ncbi:hypothetical protein OSTOST_23111, partial [Ostertagia ostertagi]
TALADLLLFIASDVTFSALPPSEFQAEFARSVYEEIVIGAFKDITAIAETYGSSEGETRYANPLMMLLIAFTLHHLANKSSQYLLSLCREQFSLTTSKATVGLTGVTEVTTMLKSCSQALLRRFAKFRGLELGEALVITKLRRTHRNSLSCPHAACIFRTLSQGTTNSVDNLKAGF